VDYKGGDIGHPRDAVVNALGISRAPLDPPQSRAARRVFGVLSLLALASSGAFLVRHAAPGVGGADSSGYANTARRLAAGTLVERPRTLERLGLSDDLAPLFIPLGFVAGPTPGTMAPLYPVGFPAHVAVAAALAGWERGPFWISPAAAVLCLLLLYGLARELSLSRVASAAGAAMLAAWPTFLFQALQPMSDVVATLWCLAAILFALRARRRRVWAVAAGAAFGIAVLVRPTSVLLALPLAFAMPASPPALLLFVSGGVPFAGLLAAFNLRCYGRALGTGWEKEGLLQAIAFSNFPPRFSSYGLWIVRTLTPLVPLGWLAAAAGRKASARDRALLLSWFGAFLLFHCFYGPYESFLFLRFLLPGVPALILGALLAARELGRAGRRPVVAGLAAATALAAILWVEIGVGRRIGILGIVEGEGSLYASACRWAQQTIPHRSLVVAMLASGALEYYTDLAYARWDRISPDRFPDLRAAAEGEGFRFFALLFPEEEKELASHVPGHWARVGMMRQVSLWHLEP
jgi:hypothetical protein